tara:strand:+ start:2108 stop:2338 length:231 start_codon:yes stop_codon:yes gene_type:complete
MAIKYTVHTLPDGFGGTFDAVIETGKCGNFPTVAGNSEYEKFLKDVKTEGISIVDAKDADGNSKDVPSWVSEAAGI